jgi:hypothetical protein
MFFDNNKIILNKILNLVHSILLRIIYLVCFFNQEEFNKNSILLK